MKKGKIIATSIASIAMCASLIAGGTYALFTSESTVNIAVTSGKVDVNATIVEDSLQTYSYAWNGETQKYDSVATEVNGTFTNGGTATFDSKAKLSLDLLSPGDKATFTIDVDNQSNINVKYRVCLSAEGELAPALVATANIEGTDYVLTGVEDKKTLWQSALAKEEIEDIEVTVEFPDRLNNNDYMEKTATLTYTLEAVQGNANVVDHEVTEEDALQAAFDEGGYVTYDGTWEGKETLVLNGKDVVLGTANLTNTNLTQVDEYNIIQFYKGETLTLASGANLTVQNQRNAAAVNLVEYYGNRGGGIVLEEGSKITAKGEAVYGISMQGGSSTTMRIYLNGSNLIEVSNGATGIMLGSAGTYEIYVQSYEDYKYYSAMTATDGTAVNVTWYVGDDFAIDQDGAYHILNEQGLMNLSGCVVKKDTTIVLDADLNMENQEFKTLVAWYTDLAFIGNNHTISNVRFERNSQNNGGASGDSMFYTSTNSTLTVSDLKFVNAQTEANTDGRYAAVVESYAQGTVTLNNVDVESSAVVGTKSSGILLGHIATNTVTLEGCDVKNSTVTLAQCASEPDGHYAGKIVGTIEGDRTLTMNNCTIENVTVSGALNTKNVGEIYGRNLGTLIVDGVKYVKSSADVNGALKETGKVQLTESMTLTATQMSDTNKELMIALPSDVTVTVASGAVQNKDLTFTGEGTVQFVNTNPGYEGKLAYHDGANLLFDGVTFDSNEITGICARGGEVTFKDCTITGEMEKTIANKFKFIGCTFDVGVTQVGYGCSDVSFEKCTFNTDGYGIKVYSEGQSPINLTVKNCSFKNTNSETKRSAILLDHIIAGIKYNITIEGCTFEGYTETPTATYNKWAERMIVADSVKTANGQYIFAYQTAVDGGYHQILSAEDLVVTVK